jgi:hypothetical protein
MQGERKVDFRRARTEELGQNSSRIQKNSNSFFIIQTYRRVFQKYECDQIGFRIRLVLNY